MDHTPRDRQIPGEPSPAAGTDQDDRPPGCLAVGSGVRQLRWARCPDDGRLHLLGPVEVVVAATGGQAEALCGRALPTEGLTDPPLISADAAARALQEHFLTNADRGDNAANDELVTEILRRLRTLRASGEGGC